MMFLIVKICVLVCGIYEAEATQSVELDLVTNLTSHYDINARPVADAGDAVAVEIGIGLQQIIELHEPTQILATNLFLRIFWTDAALTWDPADYHNISSVRINVNRIWRPDITLYNDVSTDRRNVEALYPASVSSAGRVAWLSPTIFYSSCTLNMRFFPWDKQKCELELGSWTYDSSAISVSKYGEGGDISPFIENGEWQLDGMPSEVISALYACCPHPYESVIFTIQVTRKPMYYLINIVLPCVFVSFVGLLTFILPPTSGEKVSLAVTVLLASTVFLLIVAEALPPQSTSVPLVSQYFESVICLLALTAVITVFIINIHHRGAQYPRPPRIIRIIFLDYLSRAVCMHSIVGDTGTATQKSTKIFVEPLEKKGMKPNVFYTNKVHDSTLINGVEKQQIRPREPAQHLTVKDLHDLDKPPTTDSLLQDIWSELRNIREGNVSPSFNGGDTGSGAAVADSVREWILVAMVLDRLFLAVFLLVTLVTSLVILLSR